MEIDAGAMLRPSRGRDRRREALAAKVEQEVAGLPKRLAAAEARVAELEAEIAVLRAAAPPTAGDLTATEIAHGLAADWRALPAGPERAKVAALILRLRPELSGGGEPAGGSGDAATALGLSP